MKNNLEQKVKFSVKEFIEKMKKANLKNFPNFMTQFPQPISLRCPYCEKREYLRVWFLHLA